MSNDIAIKVDQLSKRYVIGERQSYLTLQDQMIKFAKHPFGLGLPHDSQTDFWALKNVSFEVNRGEVVGIIGRNGAGKSTLLKIISRITEPSDGSITLHGRVASLLEVGTGFSPELTGRENIYLNGSILGMTRKEIDSKFDEIVEFAGISQFLDTPVKRYSSGMYVRLAFAIAAHLDSEILIVDEVLAVGDAEFQEKCLSKMSDITNESGRTILFVSHNLNAVQRLCSSAILLDHGEVQHKGTIPEVVSRYTNTIPKQATVCFKPNEKKPATITKVEFKNVEFQPSISLPIHQSWHIDIHFLVNQPLHHSIVCLQIYTNEECILLSSSGDTSGKLTNFEPGEYDVRITIPEFLLNVGRYGVVVSLQHPGVERYDRIPEQLIEIVDSPTNLRSRIFPGSVLGKLGTILNYEIRKQS